MSISSSAASIKSVSSGKVIIISAVAVNPLFISVAVIAVMPSSFAKIFCSPLTSTISAISVFSTFHTISIISVDFSGILETDGRDTVVPISIVLSSASMPVSIISVTTLSKPRDSNMMCISEPFGSLTVTVSGTFSNTVSSTVQLYSLSLIIISLRAVHPAKEYAPRYVLPFITSFSRFVQSLKV